MDVIQILRSYDIPVGSYIAAIQYLNDREPLSLEKYERRVAELTGTPVIKLDPKYARYIYLYLVQEIIRESSHTDIFDLENLLERSMGLAVDLLKQHPELDSTKASSPKLDNEGNPQPKKGAKKELAREVYFDSIKGKGLTRKAAIEIFVKEVGLTPAGASTYYANCKKQYGV